MQERVSLGECLGGVVRFPVFGGFGIVCLGEFTDMVDERLNVECIFKVAVAHLQGGCLLFGLGKLSLVVGESLYCGVFLFGLGKCVAVGERLLRFGPLGQRIARCKRDEAVGGFGNEIVVGIGAVHVLDLENHRLVGFCLFGAGLAEFIQHGVCLGFPLGPQGLDNAKTFQVGGGGIGIASLVQGIRIVKDTLDQGGNLRVRVGCLCRMGGRCRDRGGFRGRDILGCVQSMAVQGLRIEVDFVFGLLCASCLARARFFFRRFRLVFGRVRCRGGRRFRLRVCFRCGCASDAGRHRKGCGNGKIDGESSFFHRKSGRTG